MDKFIIEGGNKLEGEVKIGGFKNAAVAILPACILASGEFKITNLPNIRDIRILCEILRELGADVDFDGSTAIIDTTNIKECVATHEMASKLRASYYLIGAGLARFNYAKASYPGGCEIGRRPIDQHIKGFEALGAKFALDHGLIEVKSDQRLKGTEIYLDVVSVGATINIMMASVMAQGTTIIENAAKEPHVVDLANFLNAMGANIIGAGTDVIKIKGVDELHACEHMVIPDQIEAGTYMIMAAASKGDVLVKNVIPIHLEPVSAKLREMGVEVHEYDDSIRVIGKDELKPVNIKTLVYPGFPTDLQQPMTVLLTRCKGNSMVTETIFENRFGHVNQLNKMGANIRVENRTAVVSGVEKLSGTKLKASDLRAGASLMIAALIAGGKSEIESIYHIERGYENILDKVKGLNGRIEKIRKVAEEV
ncbi:MAG: UDP-N-acetylglucosamine 1-carboxyvinyltransferase [Peptostreptococcaceae bacterium]|jgi:UDP-N-acetylglucosamine 1-carboxyvinyltransferase|nr:UDP-N-acetylglucosamine 1-carboxyvinyltransferase [Peptostreptococcaceae bacterium]